MFIPLAPPPQMCIGRNATVAARAGSAHFLSCHQEMLVRLCLLGLLATAAARVTCPKGVFLEGGSVCAKCTKGQYNHLFDSDHCFMCPSGKFSAEEGAIGCQSCPSGYYTNGDGFESCTACKIGTYGSFEGARSAHTCAQCPAGKFGQKAPLEEDYRNQNGLTRYTVGAPICTHW